MRIFLSIVLVFQVVLVSTAQYHDNLMFGLRLGAGYNFITNLPNTLIDEENRPMYNMEERKSISPVVALFAHYQFEKTQVALEGRLSFFRAATEVRRHSIFNTNTESFDFRFQYISFDVSAKVYLRRGFLAGTGIGFGHCLNSNSGIRYDASFYSSSQILQITQQMSQALNSQASINAMIFAGYDFKNGFSIELAYIYGLADIIDTVVNPHNFSESRNNLRNIQLTVGWAISNDGFYNK